jgi:broad specificity phosphatase PhoE
VIVVRHAEVVVDGSGDPPLSDPGRARAQLLAGIAAGYDVDAAFVTPFRRTTHTALPAAERLGLKSVDVPIPAGVPAHVADLAARVLAAPGIASLVVGHSNTVPAVILSLTGVDVGTIEENEFDRLFILRFPVDGPPTVEQLTY